jgi:soluble lytic murein transglycosylase-like protein
VVALVFPLTDGSLAGPTQSVTLFVLKILSPIRHHCLVAFALLVAWAPAARALEHITLANGFELDCVRREVVGNKLRLYFAGSAENYMDVMPEAVVRVEVLTDPPAPLPVTKPSPVIAAATPQQPTAAELQEILTRAGAQHNIDAELLASVVHAESGGLVHAVSRVGAQGLMQLMPGTAATLGVKDAFVAGQNVEGGTRYLDQLLTRYHDNIALALAAYNAGPGAVDRYHGIPPYRETRAYVARVIREFNRRKTTLVAQTAPVQPK